METRLAGPLNAQITREPAAVDAAFANRIEAPTDWQPARAKTEAPFYGAGQAKPSKPAWMLNLDVLGIA